MERIGSKEEREVEIEGPFESVANLDATFAKATVTIQGQRYRVAVPLDAKQVLTSGRPAHASLMIRLAGPRFFKETARRNDEASRMATKGKGRRLLSVCC